MRISKNSEREIKVSIEKGENGLKVSGVCYRHTEFEGKYVVECPCCGEMTTPEVDAAGTRYPCCGNEFPDAPPKEFVIPVKEDKMVRKIVTHSRPGHTDDCNQEHTGRKS